MEIMEIIDMMEETIDKAPIVPLSGKILLDKEDVLDYIQEMRLVYPDEVKEAKWIKGERQRILTEAEEKSTEMIKNAEEKAIQMIDETEITRQAFEHADSIMTQANTDAAMVKEQSDQFVNDLLNELERYLDVILKKVQEVKINFNDR